MRKLLLSIAFVAMSPIAIAHDDSMVLNTSTVENSTTAEGVVRSASLSVSEFLEDGEVSEIEARQLIAFLDTKRVSKFALGRYGRLVSKEKLSAFQTAFEEYAVNQFRTHLSSFIGANFRVVEKIERRPTDVVIRTELQFSDEKPEMVNWRLMKRDDAWSIVDIEAFGFWFAIEQRAQFLATLDRNSGDIDHLIETLRAKS